MSKTGGSAQDYVFVESDKHLTNMTNMEERE